jgi:protein-tyrosine-phosphatase/predicted ATP-grasp superfamily ATP-dependent carboligase
MNVTNRVLIVGDNDLAGLTTVRSLGRAGLEVHLVAWYPHAITRSSRYVHQIHDCGHPEEEPQRFAAQILDLVRHTRFDLVIPIVDAALIPLLEVAETMGNYCVLAAPNRRQFDLTHNKVNTMRLAKRLGVDIPLTSFVSQPEHMQCISWPERLPIILKPALGGRVYRVTTYAEAEQRLERMLQKGPVLVQEFCPGYGVGVDIVGQQGKVLAAFQHVRVHEPPEGGVSSYRKSVPLSEELLATTRRSCEALQWTGPAMFEFKVDPTSGRTVLMEINGRLWGSVGLAVAAGVDVPVLLYKMLVKNEPIEVFSYRVPCFARNTRRDVFWFFDNLRTPSNHPELLKVKGLALAREVGNILLGREYLDAERLSDPLPGLISWREVGREATARMRHKLGNVRYYTLARRILAQMREQHSQLWSRLRTAHSILFLCQGNINRSAFAAHRTRTTLANDNTLQLDSAGFIAEEGRRPSRHSVMVAKTFGVDLSEHKSQVVTHELLTSAEVVFVMDRDQLRQLCDMDASAVQKTVLLGALDHDTSDWEIEDPDGKDYESYYRTYAKICRCIDAWLELRQQH